MTVAGIVDQFIKGAVGSLAKDKITSQLTPTQMELASFILNPQYYMAEKGINKIADILGYGSDYKNIQADAKSNNQYYKELMRDALGNMLPDSIGNIIRSNPKISEADRQPAGEYIAWNPDTQSFETHKSSRSVSTGTSADFDNTVRDMNYGTQTPGTGKAVGPLPEGNPIFESNVSNLPYEIKSTPVSGAPEGFDPALLAAVIRDTGATTTDTGFTDDLGEVTVVDQKPSGSGGDLSYTEMIDVLNSTPNTGMNVPATESLAPVGSTYDPNLGMNVPVTESLAPEGYMFDAGSGMNEYFGGGGGGGGLGKYYDDFSSQAYVRGGQIHRGRR